MFYILHGENELARTETLTALVKKMGAGEFAQMNTTRLDGKHLTLGELQYACDAVPFLSERRLVIVENLLARLDPRAKKGGDGETETESNADLAKGLKEYLPRLPETARLVFLETKSLAKNNPLLKFAEAAGKDGATVREFKPPHERELPHWIQERVQAKGGTIEPDAVKELAGHIGADFRLLDNEIEKLLVYRGGKHPTIRAEDVRALVPAVRETSIFELVDALGEKQTPRALKLLHSQLDHKADPLYLFAMIVRQIRMILQIKDLAARGLTRDRASAQAQLTPFVAEKVWEQALLFTLPQLEEMYQKLLETDVAIKTGKSDPTVALDLLVVELTRG